MKLLGRYDSQSFARKASGCDLAISVSLAGNFCITFDEQLVVVPAFILQQVLWQKFIADGLIRLQRLLLGDLDALSVP